jgi:RNA polymerase sigma factor (sigma-70 family)
MHERIRELDGVSQRLSDGLGRDPLHKEIVAATGWSEAEVRKVRHASLDLRSIDDPASAGWEGHVDASIDSPSLPEELREAAQRRNWLYAGLAGLKQKDAMIVAMRAGLGAGDERTLEEVGQAFGVTRERVRQIERKALETLKKRLEAIQPQAGSSVDPRSYESQATPQPEEERTTGGGATPKQRNGGTPASPDAVAVSQIDSETRGIPARKLAGVLRLLASPSRQAGLAGILKIRSLQRELARRWFEVHRPGPVGDVYSGAQHAAFHQLTAALREALSVLGFDSIDVQDLLRTEIWKTVIEAAGDALHVLADIEQSTSA